MNHVKLLVVAAALLACGCSIGSIYSGNFFYLESGGQYLPVWVVGNTTSKLFVVVLHGGPGGSSMDYRDLFTPFRDLENKCAFVYCDQPYSGSTQGLENQNRFSVDLAVGDTEKLVNLIKTRYDNPKIVLFGLSWGGALGTAYLLDANRQAEISGWIDMGSGHNMRLGLELSRQFVIDYATRIVNEASTSSRERSNWQSILDWYHNNPVIDAANVLQHAKYVDMAHRYVPNGALSGSLNYLELLEGPFDYLSLTVNDLSMVTPFLPTLVRIDYSPQMSRITVPTLALWGAKDGILPVALAQDAYDHLGSTQKKVVILPNSVHGPVTTDFPLMETALKDLLATL